jgi:hypothetical protein
VRYLLEEKTPSENETGTYANGKFGGSNAENSNYPAFGTFPETTDFHTVAPDLNG